MFITFEGIEGSGKTTQINLLADFLKEQGHEVIVTREPGGTPIGDQVRQILLDSKNTAMVNTCEVLLYYAARAQHLQELVWPALDKGQLVLCDRFVDATIAYQGYARGVDLGVLEVLNGYVLGEFKPSLSLVFDMPVEDGLKRAKARASQLEESKREDRFENEVIEFHQKVREGYLTLAKEEPERFEVVDASLDIEALHGTVKAIIEQKLK